LHGPLQEKSTVRCDPAEQLVHKACVQKAAAAFNNLAMAGPRPFVGVTAKARIDRIEVDVSNQAHAVRIARGQPIPITLLKRMPHLRPLVVEEASVTQQQTMEDLLQGHGASANREM